MRTTTVEASVTSPRRSKIARDEALDFTKGVLVLLMVVYHWTNYFFVLDWDPYRYLRFLTPSFILVTGYLIPVVYLRTYAGNDSDLHRRLWERGAKLLLLFTLLNAPGLILLALARPADLTSAAYGIYVSGKARVAFDVLVPISYFLLLSPTLLTLHHRRPGTVPIVAGVVSTVAIIANTLGYGNPILELLAFGMIGLAAGTAPERVESVVRQPMWICTLYAVYLVAITLLNILFPLQVVGACISVLLIYAAAKQWAGWGPLPQSVTALGRYSLLAYIIHIVILQGFRFGLHGEQAGVTTLGTIFVATLLLTMMAVQATVIARRKSGTLDRLYRAVLA